MRKVVIGLVTFIMVLMMPVVAQASENDRLSEWYGDNGEIRYPITCLDDGWADLTYEEQMIRCNLPIGIAESLSNEELVDLCMNYPFAFDVTAYEDPKDAFAHYNLYANQFAVLTEREGYEDDICMWYLTHSPRFDILSQSTQTTRVQDSNYDSEILAQYWLITLYHEGKMNDDQVSSLQATALERSRLSRLLGYNYLGSELLNTIQKENERNSTLFDTLVSMSVIRTNGFVASGPAVELVSGVYYTPGDYYKYGVSAPCYKHYSGDMSDSEKSLRDAALLSAHPSWISLGLPTWKYNCHSYAYLVTSLNDEYWLNSPVQYMNSGYFVSASNVTIPTGSKVAIYSTGGLEHSVVATNTSPYSSGTVAIMSTTNCNSKLGPDGLYRTTVYDMYLFYNGVSYTAYY